MNEIEWKLKIKSSKTLDEAKKKELLNILKVKSKFRKNNKTTGIDSNFFEQNFQLYPKYLR